jgi:hypothetical protein
VQLSQDPKDDPVSLEEETLEVLRKDLKKQKALEIMNTVFLSSLQLEAFGAFDPRGDETLMALQTRLAEQYLPKGNLPDPSDLSPLLAVFQDNGVQNTMSSASPVLSEVFAAMLYDSFQKTDLRNRDEVDRLGGGIRDLFLQPRPGHDGTSLSTTKDSLSSSSSSSSSSSRLDLLSLDEIEKLCGAGVSGGSLKCVYRFDEVDNQDTA